MSVNSFIPKVWSARLQENLHRQLVFGALCNRNYEGEITRYGDTVHINSLTDVTIRPYTRGAELAAPEALSGTDRTLTIDHSVYCNFCLNDVDAAQARADVLEAAMRGAARRLAEDTETYLLEVITDGAGITGSMDASGDLFAQIVGIKTAMDQRNVPRTGRALVIPPTLEGALLQDSRFVTAGGALAESALADGVVARAAGVDIYISNDLVDQAVAMTEDGVTFAQQIAEMEAYRPEKAFADAVKALSLCGAKVVVPDCVAVYSIS